MTYWGKDIGGEDSSLSALEQRRAGEEWSHIGQQKC